MARGIITQTKVVQKKETTKAVEENHKEDKVKDQKRKENEKKKVQKRKVAEVKLMEEEEAENASKKEGRKAKRAKTLKSEAEPEYFSYKRRLEDLWKEVFPVGTEWDQLDTASQYNWTFTNFEDAFEKGGELHGKRVYLLGCTEPQMVALKDVQKVVLVPVVVVVISFPPFR